MRIFTVLVFLVIAVTLAIAVWVAILFFQTDEIRKMILYATLFNTCMLAIASVRLFLWQLLLRQGVLREIKRLELRVLEWMKDAPIDRVGPIPTEPQDSRAKLPTRLDPGETCGRSCRVFDGER